MSSGGCGAWKWIGVVIGEGRRTVLGWEEREGEGCWVPSRRSWGDLLCSCSLTWRDRSTPEAATYRTPKVKSEIWKGKRKGGEGGKAN